MGILKTKQYTEMYSSCVFVVVKKMSGDSWMYPTNVPLWEIPIEALYSVYLWVIIPKNS